MKAECISFHHRIHIINSIARYAYRAYVIYHLVEDQIFEEYLSVLFGSENRFVIVFSSNSDGTRPAPHVRHRRFTDTVATLHKEWRLTQHAKNPYPEFPGEDKGSFTDFHVFSNTILQ